MPRKKPLRASGNRRQGCKDHEGHDYHLCEVVSRREMEKISGLAKNAQFSCNICGRASIGRKYLCDPVEM